MDQNHAVPSATDFDRMENQLFARIGATYRRQVIRHRLIAVAAVVVIAGAGVAAGTTATATQQGRFAYCYGGSTTHSQVAQLILDDQSGKGTDPAAGSTRAREANVLQLCQAAWSGGAFNKSSSSGLFPVPTLQACVRDDLAVSVFRRGDSTRSAAAFCENLGLSAP